MYDTTIKKKLWILLTLSIIFILPSVSALTIDDTTYFASDLNFTIFVDSVTLDQVTVTATSISFVGVTSVASNFTNANATFDARADFIDLELGMIIHNLNTSTDLFTAEAGAVDFNVTFTTGQTIQIQNLTSSADLVYSCNSTERGVFNLIVLFLALATVVLTISLMFFKGKVLLNMNMQQFIMVFVGVTIAIVFIVAVADSINVYCA